MSAKTCQLCGKPLGRIRGAEGDFCSREHRNQYQFRRGMDQLEEANKVASVMRRRENPRPIPAARLAVVGAGEPCASTEPVSFPARQAEPRFAHLQPILFQVRIADKGERFSSLLSDLSRRSGANRPAIAASLPFASRPLSAVAPACGKSMKAAGMVAAAGLAALQSEHRLEAGEKREYGAVLRVTRRALLPQRQSEPESGAAAHVERTRRLQALRSTPARAAEGETEACPAVSFKKRSVVLRDRGERQVAPHGLAPRLPQGRPAAAQDIAAHVRASTIEQPEGILRLPRLAVSVAPVATDDYRAGAARVTYNIAAGQPAGIRCSVPWEARAEVMGPRLRVVGNGRGMPERGKPLQLEVSREAAREHRPAEVRFAAAECSFDHAAVDPHGTFPGRSSEPSLDVIEEHFEAGLGQWVGNLVDWKLDAAGALPAGLALFRPTLALSDYEFEFLVRIEHRAVTFAFRAANVSNYFKVTIAMVESGRYELRRCAVIGGIEEPAAAAPLPGVLRPGAAFTVKTRATQNDFTIWLDGELAARWTDGRLPTGGIGFTAPRDDRARVYWVRLSQLDGPNSPAAAHRLARSIQ